MKDNNDIKVVIMNPECIPIVREKLFKFLYGEHIEEISKNQERDLRKDDT